MTLEITFRTLKGGTFKLPAEPTDTILDVKKKVADQQSVSDHAAYRLIYKGKILADDATITSAGISAAGFVVVMPPKKTPAKPKAPSPTKPPAETAPTASARAPTAPPAPAAPAAPTAPDAPPAPAAPAAPPAAEQTAAPSTSGANSLVTGPAYEQSVRQICEMGFPEDQVKKALRAAFNNPDRAVEFLFNGIPEPPAAPAPASPPTAPSAPAPTSPTPAPATPAPVTSVPPPVPAPRTAQPGTPFNMFEAPAGGAPDTPDGAPGSLDFLRSIPQFNVMRRLIQANPAVLPQILQQLESAYPQLMAAIDANQAEFTRLINEPVAEGDEAGDEVMEQLAQAMAGAGGTGGAPGEGTQIYVTEEEHQQINRLTELAAQIGLEQSHVLETWLACNRDETLAANFLVDHAEELRADQANDGGDGERQNQPDQPDSGNQGPPA